MRRVRVSSHQAPVHKLGDGQMKLTPRFRLAATPAPPASASGPDPDPDQPQQQASWEAEALIPGLPDDAALNCLLRLPVESHGACRLVCRRWRHLLADKARFFAQRRALGLRAPWLFTLAFHRCTGEIQWKVLDLGQRSWHAIPAMPCRDRACPRGFGCVAVPDGALVVCGGLVSDMDCPLHLVLRYDVCRNRWAVMARMLAARSFFAGGVIDGRVYVAGGYSADQFELSSAEVLDPGTGGAWRPVASMGANMASADSAVMGGRLYVTEGCAWPFFSAPRGQVYDPRADRWEAMPAGMREGWTGLSVVVAGRLFVVSEYERMKVKVYDPETDSWDAVGGAPMPERIVKPFSVSCVDSRIVVVGRGLHVAIGHVREEPAGGCGSRGPGYSVCWQDVDAPKEFSDLTPSSSQILHA